MGRGKASPKRAKNLNTSKSVESICGHSTAREHHILMPTSSENIALPKPTLWLLSEWHEVKLQYTVVSRLCMPLSMVGVAASRLGPACDGMGFHTWPRPPLHRWGIPPTREGSLRAVALCMAHRLTPGMSRHRKQERSGRWRGSAPCRGSARTRLASTGTGVHLPLSPVDRQASAAAPCPALSSCPRRQKSVGYAADNRSHR
jgi:hypothetical protein